MKVYDPQIEQIQKSGAAAAEAIQQDVDKKKELIRKAVNKWRFLDAVHLYSQRLFFFEDIPIYPPTTNVTDPMHTSIILKGGEYEWFKGGLGDSSQGYEKWMDVDPITGGLVRNPQTLTKGETNIERGGQIAMGESYVVTEIGIQVVNSFIPMEAFINANQADPPEYYCDAYSWQAFLGAFSTQLMMGLCSKSAFAFKGTTREIILGQGDMFPSGTGINTYSMSVSSNGLPSAMMFERRQLGKVPIILEGMNNYSFKIIVPKDWYMILPRIQTQAVAGETKKLHVYGFAEVRMDLYARRRQKVTA
jgi:hypothetical protein